MKSGRVPTISPTTPGCVVLPHIYRSAGDAVVGVGIGLKIGQIFLSDISVRRIECRLPSLMIVLVGLP